MVELQRQAKAKAGPSYWVVVEDHRAKVFTVFGPLAGDAEWSKRVERARDQGRKLTIWSVSSEFDVRAIERKLAARGFARSRVAIL